MEDIRGHSTFKTKINRISNAGNGIVHKGGNLKNIGPVKQDTVGQEVVATKLSNTFAFCHTDAVTVDNYEDKLIDWLTSSEKGKDNVPSAEEIREISETGPGTDSTESEQPTDSGEVDHQIPADEYPSSAGQLDDRQTYINTDPDPHVTEKLDVESSQGGENSFLLSMSFASNIDRNEIRGTNYPLLLVKPDEESAYAADIVNKDASLGRIRLRNVKAIDPQTVKEASSGTSGWGKTSPNQQSDRSQPSSPDQSTQDESTMSASTNSVSSETSSDTATAESSASERESEQLDGTDDDRSSKEQEGKSADESSTDSPSLTEEREEVATTRTQRDQAFRRQVKEVYENTCAICGAQRMTPDGRPEVEAAHIYPVEEGGPDIVQNGITLCRLHHWAFDNGWISISDEYDVLVRDRPSQEVYEDFAEYESTEIRCPDRESLQPHRQFLAKHRELHGFDLCDN